MNLSDKDYREFHDQIWERNKELIKENRKLKQELEETEHARWLCEGNWKRCEQELECAEGDCKLIRNKFYEQSSYVRELEERLRTANTKYYDIQKKNDELEKSLQNYKSDLEYWMDKPNDILEENAILNEMNGRQSNTICDLKTRNHDLELANECLVDEIREVLKDNKGLHELYMEEKEKNNNLELTNDSLTKELENLHSRIDEVCDILMDDERFETDLDASADELGAAETYVIDHILRTILDSEKAENGITITINSDNIL